MVTFATTARRYVSRGTKDWTVETPDGLVEVDVAANCRFGNRYHIQISQKVMIDPNQPTLRHRHRRPPLPPLPPLVAFFASSAHHCLFAY